MDIPKWASLLRPEGAKVAVYLVDPDEAYPAIFDAVREGVRESLSRAGELAHRDAVALINAVHGVPPSEDGKIGEGEVEEFAKKALSRCDDLRMDQYWYEACYQIIKLEMQRAVGHENFELIIRGRGGFKDRWRMSGFPEGRGWIAATKGIEAKTMHQRFTSASRPKPGAKGFLSKILGR